MPGATSEVRPWFRRWRSRRVEVRDESMAPTLVPGDHLLVDTSAYRTATPRTGDVVVVVDPEDPARWLVKRVAGLGPGTFWKTRTGLQPKEGTGERGDLSPPEGAVETVTLPPDTVWIVGDASERARDSRSFGPVPRDALVGRVYRCYAPASRRRDL
jgi:signal peptidase I